MDLPLTIVSILLYKCLTLTLTKCMEKKAWRQLHQNAASRIEQVLNATYHPSRKLSRHAGHCWRCKSKLINDALLWIPSHGRAKVGRPARIYLQQLCAGAGCSLEDLLGAMDDRDGWRERVREIVLAARNNDYDDDDNGWYAIKPNQTKPNQT